MINRSKSNLILAGALTVSFTVSAQDLPSHDSPANASRSGVVQELDLSKHMIEISAGRYTLATNVKVHSPTTDYSSLYAVKPGAEVRFSTSKSDRHGRKIIDEIWVLPPGSHQEP